jgi:hypothetical protein
MCRACELDLDLEDDETPSVGPVLLPSAAELLDAAGRSAALRELRNYVTELSGAVEPRLTLIPRWAEACGLVRVHKGTHVPMKKNAKLLKQPLELWERAYRALDEAGYGFVAEEHHVPFSFGFVFPQFLATLRMTLYSAADSQIPLELLYELADEVPSLLFGLVPDDEPDLEWRNGLMLTLDLMERLGAVELSIATDPAELAKLSELTGKAAPDPTLVGLTPIGLWATNRILRESGIDAPVVGELAGADLGEVCARISMSSPEVTEAEIRAWVGRRSPDTAAEEAAEFLRRTESPSERLFAFLALAETGEPGLAVGARVRAEGGVAGAATAVWLTERGAIAPETITPEEMALGFTDHFAALHELGGFLDELCSLDDQPSVIEVLAAADHPARWDLLDVIAEEHPDRKIAKQAKKARYALRR